MVSKHPRHMTIGLLVCSAMALFVGQPLISAAADSGALDCSDLIPGQLPATPVCAQQISRLRQVDGCQNPCVAAAGCTVPVFYDCAVCPTCNVTATTPIWNARMCAGGEVGGGLCSAGGCPECSQNRTSCPGAGTFLPSEDRAHEKGSMPDTWPRCRDCPAGRFSTLAVAGVRTLDGGEEPPHNAECHKCPRGLYQDEEGQSSCKMCEPGAVTNKLGFSGAVTCTLCFAGKVSVAPTQPCALCDSGMSTAGLAGRTFCSPCVPGKASGIERQDCQDCPAGRFQTLAVQEQCQICPGGRYQEREGSFDCEGCEPGMTLVSPVPNDPSAHDQRTDCSECPGTILGYPVLNDPIRDGFDGSTECSVCPRTEVSWQHRTRIDIDTRHVVSVTTQHGEPSVLTLDHAPDYLSSGQRLWIGSTEFTVHNSFMSSAVDFQVPLGLKGDASEDGMLWDTSRPTGGYAVTYEVIRRECVSCPTCPIGYSRFKDDGTTGCSGQQEDVEACRECPIGFVQSLPDAPVTVRCTQCPVGKTSNTDRDACVWCDTDQTAASVARDRADGRVVPDRSTCPLCNAQQFPDDARANCQAVVNVTMELNTSSRASPTAAADGRTFYNFDAVRVGWNFEHVPQLSSWTASQSSVSLCALRYSVEGVHRRCDDAGGDTTSETYPDVPTWHECARLCDRDGATLFNHHKHTRTCQVLRGPRCAEFQPAPGWFSLRIDTGGDITVPAMARTSPWEMGCAQNPAARLTYVPDAHDGHVLEEPASVNVESNRVRLQDPRTYVVALERGTLDWASNDVPCIMDTQFVKARVGLNRWDMGKYPNGSGPTRIPLADKVFAFSNGMDMLKGNTPPTLPRNAIRVLPAEIYPTSPLISCSVPNSSALFIDPDIPADGTNGSRADRMKRLLGVSTVSLYRGLTNGSSPGQVDAHAVSAYRSSRTIVAHLMKLLDRSYGGGNVEPVDEEMWPGDLQALAHHGFPESVRNSPVELQEFIETCLLDVNAVSDIQIVALARRVFAEARSSWSTFGSSVATEATAGSGTPSTVGGRAQFAFGRELHHNLFRGGQEKIRCTVSLTDGCEESAEVAGAQEVVVRRLHLRNQLEGHTFEAIPSTTANTQGGVDVVVVGAGFIAGRKDYTCVWSQPSFANSASRQTTRGTAISSTEIRCSYPKWRGVAGHTELTLDGPIAQYQGCFNFDKLAQHLDASSKPGFEFKLGTGLDQLEEGYHAIVGARLAHRPLTYSGLHSCQLQATTEAAAEAAVADISQGHGGAAGAGVFGLFSQNNVTCKKRTWTEKLSSEHSITVLENVLRDATTVLYPCGSAESDAAGTRLEDGTCYDTTTDETSNETYYPARPSRCSDGTIGGTQQECTGITGYTFTEAVRATCANSYGVIITDPGMNASEEACTGLNGNVYDAVGKVCTNANGLVIGFGGTGRSTSDSTCRGTATGNMYQPSSPSRCTDAHGLPQGDDSSESACEGTLNSQNYTYSPAQVSNCSDGRVDLSQKACTGNEYARVQTSPVLVPVNVTRTVVNITYVPRVETLCVWHGCRYLQGFASGEGKCAGDIAAELAEQFEGNLRGAAGRVGNDK